MDKYEKVFWEVASELGINEWWVLFDSEDMDIVDERCQALADYDEDEYNEWYHEMAEDL